MISPIIWGNKNLVKATLKNLPKLLENDTARIRVIYYTRKPTEFKMKFKYDGVVTGLIIPPL